MMTPEENEKKRSKKRSRKDEDKAEKVPVRSKSVK